MNAHTHTHTATDADEEAARALYAEMAARADAAIVGLMTLPDTEE